MIFDKMSWFLDICKSIIESLHNLQKKKQIFLIIVLSVIFLLIQFYLEVNNYLISVDLLNKNVYKEWLLILFIVAPLIAPVLEIPLIKYVWQIEQKETINGKDLFVISLRKFPLWLIVKIEFNILVALLMLALIIPGIVAMVYYCMVSQIVVIEDGKRKIRDIFMSSRELIKENFKLALILILALMIIDPSNYLGNYPEIFFVLELLFIFFRIMIFTALYIFLQNKSDLAVNLAER